MGLGFFFLIFGTVGLIWSISMLVRSAALGVWALGGNKKWIAIFGICGVIVFSSIQIMKGDDIAVLEKKGANAYKQGTLGAYKWLLESVVGEETPTPVPVIIPVIPPPATPPAVAPPSGIAPSSGGTVSFRGVPLDPAQTTAAAYLVSTR